jgi:hypothetical protein
MPTSTSSRVSLQQTFPSRGATSLAPAIEYNFNGNVGIIVGAIVTLSGRNTDASVIPVAAVNIVY